MVDTICGGKKEGKGDNNNGSTTIKRVSMGRDERDWDSKVVVIYAFLHPKMGKGNWQLIASAFRLNLKTFQGWMYKTEFRQKWVHKIVHLKVKDVVATVLAAVQEPFRSELTSGDHSTYRELNMVKVKNNYGVESESNTQQLMITDRNWTMTPMKGHAKPAAGTTYAKKGCKRVPRKTRSKSIKHIPVNEYVVNVCTEHLNMGVPLGKEALKKMVTSEFAGSKEEEKWNEIYGKNKDNLRSFVRRAMDKGDFVTREKSVSQKIPEDWYPLSLEGAARVRATFLRENVDVVLAADETFVKFSESSSKVIVKKGAKRVGCAINMDLKDGCTVIPTMNMLGSRLLEPVVVFKGGFGKTLMNRYATYEGALVMFSDSHWMTGETTLVYFSWLLQSFKDQTIGLIIDRNPCHACELVEGELQALNERNKRPNGTGSRLVLEWIDRGLTSIYQPGDILINKPLKQSIRSRHDQYVADIVRGNGFRPGQHVKVSRDKLLEFIKGAFEDINRTNRGTLAIYNAFGDCGLNPFLPGNAEAHFRARLDSLSKESCYGALLKHSAPLELKLDLEE
jgi:DDE superfamily endonuclease